MLKNSELKEFEVSEHQELDEKTLVELRKSIINDYTKLVTVLDRMLLTIRKAKIGETHTGN